MDSRHEEQQQTTMFNPFSYVLQFLATYGWPLVGAAAAALYALHKLKPRLDAWRQARDDAEYHKDPDRALARMEAVQRAREVQQQRLLEASQRAALIQKEREEQKRQEALERLEKYGAAAGGKRLGTADDNDYMPLAGGASTSTYRPPKRSACKGGGCGR